MLVIAISFGTLGDPFTCSSNISAEEAATQGLDLENANQMRDWICTDKGLSDPECVDEVMVIYEDEEGEHVVQHWHYEFDDVDEDDEEEETEEDGD